MEFTQEEKELMIAGNDQMIAGTSGAIVKSPDPEAKESMKQGLKKLMSLSDKLNSIEPKAK